LQFSSSDEPDALDYESLRKGRKKTPLFEDDASGWNRFKKNSQNAADSVAETGSRERAKSDSSRVNTWLARRGHAISFAGLFLFTVVLFFRPYELIPALSSLTSIAYYIGIFTLAVFVISQLVVEGNITAPLREVKLVALLGIAALLSMPMAINPGEAWETFSEILVKALLIFVVLVNVVRTWTRLRMLIFVALIVSIYLSVNAISDYQHGIFEIGKADLARVGGSIGGLFKNSNDLALHLVTMIPIVFSLGLVTKGLLTRLLYWLAAGLMVAATIVTFSRGGFLGIVGVVLVFAYKFGRRNIVGTAAILILAAVLFLALAPGSYGGRLSTIFDSASDLTGSSSQRTQVLKRSVIVALRYPLFGVGIGNFHHRSFQELGTHNAYTQVAAEIGIPAFVVYVMFLLYPLKRLRQIEKATAGNKEARRLYYLSIGLQGSIIGYMVSSFFCAVAYQWYVYYIVGYAICMHRLFLMETPGFEHVSWVKPFTKETKRAERLEKQAQVVSTSQV
jgi:O-antigen ligase